MSTWTGGTLATLPVGHAPTAAELGEYRNALAAISDPWTDCSGTFAWTSAGTAPAIGNGTILARYVQVGKFILYTGSITMGTTTTFGTSTWFISLPVAPVASALNNTTCPATCLLFDNSAVAARQSGTASIFSTTQVDFYIGTGGQVTNVAPFTWATSDILGWTLQYEAA